MRHVLTGEHVNKTFRHSNIDFFLCIRNLCHCKHQQILSDVALVKPVNGCCLTQQQLEEYPNSSKIK